MGIERLPEFWPEWKVEAELGEGAFGKVYRVVDNEAGFPVYSAIKVLSVPSSKAEIDALRSEGMTAVETESYFNEIVDGFVNEIKVMNALKGAPNIVGVEAFKKAQKRDMIGWDIFIRMELLTSFKDYLESKTPNEDEIIKLGIDIASALEICQSRNIIHRDIKPANIFIDGFGNFKLGDFGIAKELEKTTGAVSSKGTFSYMAPEVARGMRYDSTVDIYSLGLVMYSLLNNNRPPFVDPYKTSVGYNERKIANDRRLSGDRLPPPCNAHPNLASIILTACSYGSSQRFRNPTALKNALISYKSRIFNQSISVPRPAPISKTTSLYDPEGTITAGHIFSQDIDQRDKFEFAKKEFEHFPIRLGNPSIGDTVRFGFYEQGVTRVKEPEELEWVVLDKRDGNALIMTKYAIDVLPYNTEDDEVTWESCTLRRWLNYDFLNTAFSDEMIDRIKTAVIKPSHNYNKQVTGGASTEDKVFLLGIEDVNTYLFDNRIRQCRGTPFARKKGLYANRDNGYCYWWLRTPGLYRNFAAYVYAFGGIVDNGNPVYHKKTGIRPVIWVELDG